MLQGVQLAVEDVNRRGGAGGHRWSNALLRRIAEAVLPRELCAVIS